MNNNISTAIYNELKFKILNIELLPGSQLAELEIANLYNTSRTPVKNALTRLELEGLVSVRKNVGTFVTKLDPKLILTSLEVRTIIESSLFKDYHGDYTELFELELKLCIAKQKKLISNSNNVISNELAEEFMSLDDEFHALIFSYFDKLHLWDYLQSNAIQYWRYRIFVAFNSVDGIKQKVSDHEQLLKLITETNTSYESFYQSHIISSFETQMIKYIEKYPNFFT